jgi:hypothetical protein
MHMPANKPKQDSRSTTKGDKAAEEASFEITYLQNKFLVSRQKVEEAMKASGNNRQLVEAYLTKYTTRKPILL